MRFSKRMLFFLFALASLMTLTGCGHKYEKTIICKEELAGEFSAVAHAILPTYTLRQKHYGELQGLKEGSAVLTDEILAVPSMEMGIADYWYPQYLATVVIAVDREETSAEIFGWNDLLLAGETVGMSDQLHEARLLLSAISYGLEGEAYTLTQSSNLLASLYSRELLRFNAHDVPILICFDYQAAALKEGGRSFEIILPAEGTLTFEKGILSGVPLDFSKDREAVLLQAGYRLPDGRSRAAIYPSDYRAAARPGDRAYAAKVFDDTAFVMKRDVQKINSYLYSSNDGRNHQLFGLAFIVLAVLWTGNVLKRVAQNGIRRAILVITILIVGWVLLRMFKYQMPLGFINMFCWYGYYFFRLSLPLAGLWLACAIDQPNEGLRPPKWWYACAVFNFMMVVLIFTNNLHYQAFRFDPADSSYNLNFSYGPVYYIATIAQFIQLFIIQVIIIRKSLQSPRKHGLIFPIVFYALIGLYCTGYVLRVPLIWETDSTLVTCTLTIVFADLCTRSGLIPVNSKYKALFARSPLNMQIMDSSGDVVMQSGAAAHRSENRQGAEAPHENILLYKTDITGGRVVWQEDIGSLNRLHREITDTNIKLRSANAILAEEERVKGRLAAADARTVLFAELEAEIQKRTLELRHKIELLRQDESYKSKIAVITLLLCYIKRRCILFFRERETPDIPLDEIVVYLDELGEFASFVGIRLHVLSILYGTLPTRHGTLFYDFVYSMLEWSLTQKRDTMLVQILAEQNHLIVKSMCEEYTGRLPIDPALAAAVKSAGGCISLKEMDDIMGVWLSFPEGGAKP